MKTNEKLYSVALASTAIVLFLIFVLSTASAATTQIASQAVPYAYITNSGGTTVSVIDTSTNKITATVNIGSSPYGVAVNPAGTKVYVASDGSDTVSVIDTATNKITASVPIGSHPWGVAVNPAGTKVYVANEGSGTVSVIDTATNNVTATVNVGNYPCGVAVNPAGTKVYVVNTLDNTVSVVDTATNKVTATVPVGNVPTGVAVNPAGTKVYVTNEYDVSVVDTATNKVTATVNVGSYPWGVAVNPAGTKVYVTNYGDNTVSVVDTATNKITATVSVGDYPLGVAINLEGTKVYVANEESSTVSVIDTATNKITATVPVGKDPVAFGQFIGSVPVKAPILPVANFGGSPVSGKAPLNVIFTDTSTGSPTAWKWNFGDGTTSTAKNPTHTYSAIGNYTVKLTATNAAGSNTVIESNYIKVASTLQTPVASFTSNVTSGNVPLSVAFTDKSTGSPTSWKWSFGDGTSSTQQSPTYKYSAAGNYTVTLTATNAAGSNTVTKSNYIKVTTASQTPIASFISNVTSGNVPLSVAFTDKSTGSPTSWKWSFGDGTSSTVKSPTHKYSAKGSYTVILTATNAAGSNTVTKSNYITVTSTLQTPVADFWGLTLSGKAPLNVVFTETSTGSPTSWKWDFGDGTSSTVKSPTHKYSAAGNYTVTLTATNAAGSNTKTKFQYIKVTTASQTPVADFWGLTLSGKAPLNVVFTETSTGSPTSWKWNFGDGTSSTQQSPTHKYSAAGNYTVALTATNAAGSNTKTKFQYIKVTAASQTPVAVFSASPTSGNAPLNVVFTETSTGSPTSWKWNFGDGTSSTVKSPTHKYSAAGNYTVTLTATNAAGSNTKTKSSYIKVTSTSQTPVADFWGLTLSGKAPLNVVFTETSTGSPTSWKWSFGDGTSSTQQSPTHKYSAAGNYTVALTATNAAGSNTKTKFQYIKVTAASQTPVAVFSASPTSGNAPLSVVFTDKSTGSPTLWKWSFGDGTTSTVQNPTHKYSAKGNYTVTLTATNAAGSNTVTKSNYIKVTSASQIPVADFWGLTLSGKAPLNVVFTETSTGSPTSWKWNFGDGTSSTVKSPTHKYSAAGNYTVTLTATNAAGSNTKTKFQYIKVTAAS